MATVLSTCFALELKHSHGSHTGSSNPAQNFEVNNQQNSTHMNNMPPPTPATSDDETSQEERILASILNSGSIPGLEYDNATGTIKLDDVGEKADDAVDYEDMDELADEEDDGLPEESEESTRRMVKREPDEDHDELMDVIAEGGLEATDQVVDEADFRADDLFGDMEDIDMEGNIEVHVNAPGRECAFGESGIDLDVSLDFMEPGTQPSTMVDGTAIDTSHIKEEEATDEDEPGLYDKLERSNNISLEERPQHLLKTWFPDFEPHKVLNFNALIPIKPATLPSRLTRQPKPIHPTKLVFEPAPDTERTFMKTTSPKQRLSYVRGVVMVAEEPSEDEMEQQEAVLQLNSRTQEMQREIEVACQNWEDRIDPPTPPEWGLEYSLQDEYSIDFRSTKRPKLIHNYIDELPDSWLDADAIIEGNISVPPKVTLDLNDPFLLVDIRQPTEIRKTRRIGGEFKRKFNRDLIQRYNISNDEAYDLLKENKQSKVRSQIGQLTIEHSMPALRLQTPFYKTRLSIREARSFHRPSMQFHKDVVYRFGKIKKNKKKNIKGKDIKEILQTTADLSLSDNSNYVLLEYSEEYPTVMSNFGMGSRLINYYRRKSPDDEYRPKLELGETQILMPQDRSPFWNFGTVTPGEVVPTLYNRMIRAPIFKHTAKPTDFLVIRTTNYEHGSKFYLRTIPHLFVVGQTFPVTEVPGPSSRKMTTVAKNRLKMVCYRIMKRKENKAITLKDIAPHFPESNDPQNRSKLKEFLQMNREIGMWEMRLGETIPEENTIRAMVDPESVCLLEAMQVGFRHLQDAGYSKTVDDDDDDDEKQAQSLEQQLAPWKTTKNFIHATQGKAMLKLHGEGDPSGRGEAFSFIRTSMKGGFKAIGESVEEKMDKARLKELGGHSYNVAKQQKAYEEAIEQIWKAQYRSLSNTEEQPIEDLEDAHRDDQVDDLFEDGETPKPMDTPTPGYSACHPGDETATQFSRLSQSSQRNKVLRIVREVRREDGKIEKDIVVVKDPKVIRQYLLRRRAIEAENIKLDSLVPTGDAEADKQQKKLIQQELQRLLRNKERREARERQGNKKIGIGYDDAGSPGMASPGSPSIMAPSPAAGGKSTTRKCANCGMVGHIRTNKKLCPKLNPALNGGSPAVGSPGTPGTPADVMSPPQ